MKDELHMPGRLLGPSPELLAEGRADAEAALNEPIVPILDTTKPWPIHGVPSCSHVGCGAPLVGDSVVCAEGHVPDPMVWAPEVHEAMTAARIALHAVGWLGEAMSLRTALRSPSWPLRRLHGMLRDHTPFRLPAMWQIKVPQVVDPPVGSFEAAMVAVQRLAVAMGVDLAKPYHERGDEPGDAGRSGGKS
jgi:hypothetical protein